VIGCGREVVSAARAAPKELAEIGAEGVCCHIPFEQAAETVLINIPTAVRTSGDFGHVNSRYSSSRYFTDGDFRLFNKING
jgi:hypothetical protein